MSARRLRCYYGNCVLFQGVCTEAGMYALRERRVHVTQEDFELAVAKVSRLFVFTVLSSVVSSLDVKGT